MIFSALRASVWSNNKGMGAVPPGPSPGYATAFQQCRRIFANLSGEGRTRNEFAEWHMAWLAEWHTVIMIMHFMSFLIDIQLYKIVYTK